MEDEANVRMYAEPPNPNPFTREQLKKMLMEKAALEWAAEKMVTKMNLMSI